MLFDVVIFLLVLGLLVFFHEMGHFLAAKACGIYVDRFSLGMPPRIWGFKWGDTDYCIGALPIGGYVKMAGQEDAPRSEEEQMADYSHVPPEQWFNKKPIWQRYIVILAGPAMNIVLALILYAIVAAVGAQVPEFEVDNRIGMIKPGSPASEAPLYEVEEGATDPFADEPDASGWQTGDRIVSINGEKVSNIRDVAIGAVLGGEEMARVIIEREAPDGTTTRYISPVRPKKTKDSDYPQFGVGPYHTALVSAVMEGRPADKSGLEAGDVIVSANGKKVDSATFSQMVEKLEPGTEIMVGVEREGELLEVPVSTERVGRFLDVVFSPPLNLYGYVDENGPITVQETASDLARELGLEPGAVITSIGGEDAGWHTVRQFLNMEDGATVQLTTETGKTVEISPKDALQLVAGYDADAVPTVALLSNEAQEATGLRRGDEILEVNGQPATVDLLRELERDAAGETLTLKVRRPAVLGGIRRAESIEEAKLEVSSVSAIGVVFGTRQVFHRYPPGEVLPHAYESAMRDVSRIIQTLEGLIFGRLSAKELGGPVMIFQVTTTAAELGYSWLLQMTAFISVNLAIFNLLPLPVLDGGQCVLLAVEGIRRKPLDVRIVEKIQQFGLLLIIFLMLFVTVNDVQRWFQGLLS